MSNFTCISKNVLANIYAVNQTDGRYDFVSDKSILEWEYRYHMILSQISGYDIICLQEVQLEYIENNSYFIKDLHEYDFYSHQITKNRSSSIGNVIFWKKDKFIEKSTINNSCGVFVVLEYSQKDFFIGNIHLRTGKSRDDVRIHQLKSCFKIINKYNINTFMTGDFNDGLRPEYSTTNFILEQNFKIIASGNTCHLYKDGKSIFLPLDHVVTNNLNIVVKKRGRNGTYSK